MAGRKLTANVVLRNPDTGAVETFAAGSEPPGWGQVGDHVLEASKPAPRKSGDDK